MSRQLAELKRAVPADADRAARRRDRGLSGRLERLSFPALLHHLHGLRATGVLHLASGRKRKWIQFRDGYPVAVRGNLVNETLGNILVRKGRVSPADAEESRRRMGGGRLQGEILVAMEALTEQEMVLALRAQAEQKLFEIFTWESGPFRFEIGGLLQRANSLPVERSPANLILTGVRRRLPAERVDQFFEANLTSFVAPAENAFHRFQDIELDPDQQALLDRLDGSQRLSDFLVAEDEVRRTLLGLVAAGVLRLRTGPPRRAGCPRASETDRRPPGQTPPPELRGAADDDRLRARFAAMAERFRGQNHFEVLEVSTSASDDELHSAYARLAERAHPDQARRSSQAVQKLAAQVFEQVQRAHDTLMDPRRRQAYLLDLRRVERESAEREAGRQALDAELEYQRGEAALRQKDYPKALQHLGKALELYPEEGEYHASYGWALHLCHPGDAGMAGEAIEHVRRGLKLAGHREKPYLFMGRLCKAIGRIEVAEKMFNRAVQVQPDCAEALSELRLIQTRRRKAKGLIGRLLRR